MNRSLRATLWIGAIAVAIVIVLQKSGLLLRPELWIERWTSDAPWPNEGTRFGNYALVVFLGFAVGWTMLQVTPFARRAGLVLLLLAELVGAACVLHLAAISFQPLPGIVVTLLSAALAIIVGFTQAGRQQRALRELFKGRLADTALTRLTESNSPELSQPRNHEVTFVYCEIGNQSELIDALPPADYAELMRRLGEHAAELFLEEGGYLHAADGEGIRVVFGFPHPLPNHAAAAARAALAFRDRVAVLAFKEPDSLGKIDLRIGVSAGPVVATIPGETGAGGVVISGEPIEIARRLAVANQIYGSKILLGPRAFSAAGAEIVARPIDFLRSGEAHDRLEVYELLALAAEASAEEIACRDCFWTGLVYFRERRWSEAFAEFNRARRANSETDQPLQWYLRRLEPLILQMTTEPAPVADPFSPH